MSKRKELKKIEKLVLIAGTIALFLFGFLLGPYVRYGEVGTNEPKENPKFIISSWPFPDEYGQGIYQIDVYDNETGSWLPTPPDAYRNYTEPSIFNITAGYAIKLRARSWLNSTLVGCSSLAQGKLYQRHNVTLTFSNGTVIFTQENFTYVSSYASGNMYSYTYEVILNFIPVWFMTYIATINYEIYWGIEPIPQTILATSGLDDWADSLTIDTITWSANDNLEYANFFLDNNSVASVTYSVYAYGYQGEGYLSVWNGTDYVLLETIVETLGVYSWYNGTLNDPAYITEGNRIQLAIFSEGLWAYAAVDYAQIVVNYTSYFWNTINDISIYFTTGMSPETEWALNGWYMLLGIGLVIFSGIFLAIGGRERLTLDKGYMAVIMFIVGWALIIGVVI